MSVLKVRKPTGPFEVIDRASVEAIRDPTALAVWVFLRCKPEGWIVRETHVREQFGIGRDKYRSAIRYLTSLGAVEDRRIQGDHGRIVGRELVIHYAIAQVGSSDVREPENPSHGTNQNKELFREPENPSHGSNRAPEKTVTRRKPTDGKTAPLENTQELESTDLVQSTLVQDGGPTFSEFWNAYPVKRDKQRAEKAFSRLTVTEAKKAIADIPVRLSGDRQWIEGYIPHPSTYLNGKRWEDDITGPVKAVSRKPTLAESNRAAMDEWLKSQGQCHGNLIEGEFTHEYE